MNVRAGMNALQATPSLARPSVGAGLKPAHYAAILEDRPAIGFFEIHAENYMNAGGPNHRWLAAIRELYPLSVHGVGLSLGSTEPLDRDHLARLKRVVERTKPALVSEHLAWSTFAGRAFPDLLPLPYDDAGLRRIAERIDRVQAALGRRILIENPATYLRFAGDGLVETQFLEGLCAATGCGLLLDVNNVFVSAANHRFDARHYLDALPLERVEEIHLAGHAEAHDRHGAFLIDDHGGPVAEPVWALYRHAIARGGPRPTLIEWDNNVPDWPVLLAETQKARAAMEERAAPPAAADPVSQRAPIVAGAPGWQGAFAGALGDPAAPIPPLFAPCDEKARFAVYRNNVAVAQIGALKEQFPIVLQLIGDEAFSGLARAFARQSPPRSPVLGDYGADFPAFLETFLTETGESPTPYLPDMARLDWACLSALRAPEAESCDVSQIAALDPARLGAARALTHPSLALVASDWPLLALRDPGGKPIADWSGETVLVLRPGAELHLVSISSGAATFLRACAEGADLAAAATRAEGADPGFAFGPTLVDLTRASAFTAFTQQGEDPR
jgi:uncharacterized protein